MLIADGGLTLGKSLLDFRNKYMQEVRYQSSVPDYRYFWDTNKSKIPALMDRLQTGCLIED